MNRDYVDRIIAAVGILAIIAAGVVAGQYAGSDAARTAPSVAGGATGVGALPAQSELGLQKVMISRDVENGLPTLVIVGEVMNVARVARDVPKLRVILQDSDKHELRSWSSIVTDARLAPGASVPFRTGVAEPSAAVTGVVVTFDTAGGLDGVLGDHVPRIREHVPWIEVVILVVLTCMAVSLGMAAWVKAFRREGQPWLYIGSTLVFLSFTIYVFYSLIVVDGSWVWAWIAVVWVQDGFMFLLRRARRGCRIRLWMFASAVVVAVFVGAIVSIWPSIDIVSLQRVPWPFLLAGGLGSAIPHVDWLLRRQSAPAPTIGAREIRTDHLPHERNA